MQNMGYGCIGKDKKASCRIGVDIVNGPGIVRYHRWSPTRNVGIRFLRVVSIVRFVGQDSLFLLLGIRASEPGVCWVVSRVVPGRGLSLGIVVCRSLLEVCVRES